MSVAGESWEHDQGVSCSLLLHNTFAASSGNGLLLVHETKPHQHKVERLPLLAMCHQLVSRFRHLLYSIKARFLIDYFLFSTKIFRPPQNPPYKAQPLLRKIFQLPLRFL